MGFIPLFGKKKARGYDPLLKMWSDTITKVLVELK
jgi:hypothetical protein